MKKSTTLKFGIGCSILVFSAILQMVFPGFLTLILILFAVGFCIRQWSQHTRELRYQIAQEQKIRLAADQYIHVRFK